jgi:sodium pump decarboxylase gamma subunit
MGNIAGNFVGWEGGVLLSVIAFSVVFIVLAMLMAMIMALKVVSRRIDALGTAAETAAKPQAVHVQVTHEPQPTAQAAPASDDDSELIAVLTAAITASLGKGAAILGYAPVESHSPKPVNAVPAWRMASIMDNSVTPRS